jgi:hypothetical protein
MTQKEIAATVTVLSCALGVLGASCDSRHVDQYDAR